MTDILLIKPKSLHGLQCVPPLGLGFIAAYLRSKGRSVDILDAHVLGLDAQSVAERATQQPYRLIGVQCFDIDVPMAAECVAAVRRRLPDVPVIVGGPAAASDFERLWKLIPGAEYLCFGEGEQSLADLLDLMDKGEERSPEKLAKVRNLKWGRGETVVSGPHEYMGDLDEVGAPAWDLLGPQRYGNAVHGFFYRYSPVYPIMVTRGCPFRCSFCGSRLVTGYKVRRRSPANVVDELVLLRDKYGMREYQIVDDNFTASPRLALEFCLELTSSGLVMPWTCPNGLRLDTLDRELLLAMKAAGCYEVSVGIESGDQSILDAMNKNLTLEVIQEKVALIRECGIQMNGFIIVGYPGETVETLTNSMKFAFALPLNRISLSHFTPLPGTPVYENLFESGALPEEAQSGVGYEEWHYVPETIGKDELERLYRKFFWGFYLRPRVIWHNLKAIRSPSHLRHVLKRAISYLH